MRVIKYTKGPESEKYLAVVASRSLYDAYIEYEAVGTLFLVDYASASSGSASKETMDKILSSLYFEGSQEEIDKFNRFLAEYMITSSAVFYRHNLKGVV